MLEGQAVLGRAGEGLGRPTEGLDRLVLGCGTSPELQAVNLDQRQIDGRVDRVHDITDAPWPFPDGRFRTIAASHVLEHVPHHVEGSPLDGLVIVMNEAWRVLAPGGQFEITCPTINNPQIWRPFADPTHTRVIMPQTFYYFGRPPTHVPGNPSYQPKMPDWDWQWYGSDYGIEARFDCELLEVEIDLYALLRKPLYA